MIKKLAFFLFTACTLTFFCSMLPEKSGDTWWYVQGLPYYWYFQPDVFAFRLTEGKRWEKEFDASCVEFHYHRSRYRDKLNIIYFNSRCSESEKNSVKEMIRSSQGFESEFPVITSYPNLGYQSGAWFVLDDLLLVNFNPDSLNKNRFSEFKQDYGLEQLNFPDSVFPEGIFTYIFQFNVNDVKPGSAIDLSKSIYLQDSGLVINVQPNLINAYEKIPPENSFSTNKELPENDVEYYLVHTQNKSVLLFVRLKGEAPLAMIRVYDLFGREVYSFQAVEEYFNLEIDISDYAGGIYFACIENERGEVMGMQKFVKL